jgi:hypothetical protein
LLNSPLGMDFPCLEVANGSQLVSKFGHFENRRCCCPTFGSTNYALLCDEIFAKLSGTEVARSYIEAFAEFGYALSPVARTLREMYSMFLCRFDSKVY